MTVVYLESENSLLLFRRDSYNKFTEIKISLETELTDSQIIETFKSYRNATELKYCQKGKMPILFQRGKPLELKGENNQLAEHMKLINTLW